MRPAALRPWAIRTLSPAASRTAGALYGRATVVSLPVIVAATPLTSALTTPGPTVPLTAMDSVATANPSAGGPFVIYGSPATRWRTIVAGLTVRPSLASGPVSGAMYWTSSLFTHLATCQRPGA